MHTCRLIAAFVLALASTVSAAPIAIAPVQRAEPVSFEKEIFPMLQRSCLACHSASEKQGDLVLESPQGILKGGDNGPAAIAGKGAESLIVKAAAHQIETVMPPVGNDVAAKDLTSQELGLLKLWIDQGAQGIGAIDSLSPQSWQAMPKGIQAVQAISITEDGQYVACSRANRILLFHVPTGQRVTTLGDPALAPLAQPGVPPHPENVIAHRDLVQSLTFNVGGDLLASGSFREVKLWRRPRDVQKFNFAAGGPVTALAISPDRKWIATPGAANTIRLWHAVDGQPGPTLTGHTGVVTSLRFTLGSTQLISGSLDQTIRQWKVADGTPVAKFEAPAPVFAVEVVMREAPTEMVPVPPQLVVSGGADTMVRVWELGSAMPEKLVTSLPNLARTVTSRDGKLMAMVDTAGTVRIVSLAPPPMGVPLGAEVTTWPVEREVTHLAFHRAADVPDATPEAPAKGTSLFTTAADGSIRQWSLPEHQLLNEWKGGIVGVRSLAVSADGTQAATGAEDGLISLWNLKHALPPTTPFLAPLAVSEAPLTSAVLSPTRNELALIGVKGGQHVVSIVNLESGQITHTFSGHTAAIRSVAFSTDGNKLVSGGDDKSVRLWDLRNPAKPDLAKIEAIPVAVTSVGTNADGTVILAGGADNTLKLFNPVDGMVLKEFAGHGGAVLACGYWNGQPYSVCVDRNVRFWNATDGAQARTFPVAAGITSFVLSTDGTRMAFGGDDSQTRVMQTDNAGLLQTLKGTTPVTALSFTADNLQLATVTAAGETTVWNLLNGRLQETFTVPTQTTATFVADALSLVTTHQGGQLGRQPLRFLRHLEGHTQPVTALLFHSNGQTLFTAGADGTFRGYTTQTGQATFNANHGAVIHDLAISAKEEILATAGENAQVRLWQPNGGAFGVQTLPGFPGPVTRVAFAADDTQLVAGAAGEKPAVLVFDVTTGAVLQRFTDQAGPTLGLARLLPPAPIPNTPPVLPTPVTTMLTSSATGVWSWSLTAVRQIPGSPREVTSLASIPGNPRQVLSGSMGGIIRRWNLETSQEMQQFNHGGDVTAIAVSPDGQRLASATENTHTAKLWNINGQQIAEMRGDLRKKTAQTQATQQLAAANARLNTAKQLLTQAEQDVPTKTTAEKTLADMLTAATTDVAAKKVVVETTLAAKIAAEKAAIDASATAKVAMTTQATAENAAKEGTAVVTAAQAKLARLQQSAAADPLSEKLKQLVVDATKAVTAATTASQQLTAAVAPPTQAATEMATLANTAAQKVNEVQKPNSDALVALKTSEANQNLLSQQQAIAARELKVATDLVPVRQDAATKAEAAVAEATKLVETSNAEATAFDLPLRSIAFSPDGTLLATAGDCPNVHTWDALTGAAMGAFAGHTGPLKAVAFLNDNQLVSASDDQSSRIWEINPGWVLERTIGSADQPTVIVHRVTAVDFSRDSSLLLIAGGVPSRSGELQVVKVADGSRVLYLPQAHNDVIYSAQFSPDARRIASGSADKYLRTFDVATSQQLRRFEGHTNYVLGVAWKGDGQIIATAGADNTVKVWEADTGDQQRTIEQFPRHVTAIRYIGETDNIITSCGDKLVRMHNASNGGLARNFGEIKSWPHCVAITPDSNIVTAGDAAGNVYFWNGNNGQYLKTLSVAVPAPPLKSADLP